MDEKKSRRSFVRVRRPAEGAAADTGPPAPSPPAEGRPAEGRVPEPGELHTRIVVPRQERGEAGRPELDIELREVRYGATSRGPYLRVVPRQRKFTRVAPGHLEATRLASVPVQGLERFLAAVKAVAIGSPLSTAQLIHERLTKVKALAVFSSDALSSSAYATEEILIVLALAGSGALTRVLPIALVITLLLAIVTLSYRQTIRAYPSGGGAYIVAHDNLGVAPGLLAAAALLVDYVLTVAVSVAAGVAAVTSAVPDLDAVRVPMGIAVVGLITLGNLRGIRESGTLFAAPTYYFILAMGALIVVGLVKVALGDTPGSLLHGAPPAEQVAATRGLTVFLVLRAFSSGSAALTGVEAISNGVPAFKPPESRNARATLTTMAVILGFLFLGVTFLSSRYGLVPSEDETIVSMLGRNVFGKNVLYYGFQVATALVLFLAANTSFADFPRLSAILAKDRFMPRQFGFKGDRLAFSNGILLLAGAAALLLAVFGGDVTNLIPLYAVGVFVSFTLSQSGMVRHWLRLREPGWRTSIVINAVGAGATAVVAVIIGATKFLGGAWISILLMLTIMLLFNLTRRHYRWFEEAVKVEEGEPLPAAPLAVPAQPLPSRERVVVPVDSVNKISLAAIALARELSSRITAVHLTDEREAGEEFRARWEAMVPDVPLLVMESPYRAFVAPMLAFVESLDRAEPEAGITVVLPTFIPRHWWERLLHNRTVLRLEPHLKRLERVRVIEFPYRLGEEAA
ncbi:MAG TPA: APC family permease [Dehalococcoidia bacterium]|nr:APC family permease [Dehalococcoidia bacterium]